MPVSPSRVAAFDILLQVEREDAYAADLLHSPKYSNLSPADHGLATQIVMGVLRWRSVLDELITRHSNQRLEKLDREVLTALRMGAYQLAYLDRIPDRAAINESVELVKRARKRSAVPFANAVLRKIASADLRSIRLRAESTPSQISDISNELAHPLWLVERWVKLYGADIAAQICTYDQRVPATSIRLHDPDVEQQLANQGIPVSPGELLTSARRVSCDVTATRQFREGAAVSIQDEASQLVALLVGKGTNILDCCAAPGGKTRMIAEQNPNAAVIAAELHPHRARLLRKLVPATNVQVITGDIRDIQMASQFDRVLADVPCSGTGTLARNPEIKWKLKPQDLSDLQARQLAILKSAMARVSPGGRLVYSTCSLEPEENEQVVEQALAQDHSFTLVDCRSELQRLRDENELAWKDLDSLISGPYLRTIPGVHPSDGFFSAILEQIN